MIESVNNEKIIKYSKLLQRKYRDEYDLYIASGEHLVLEALKRNLVVDIFLLKETENIYGNNVTYVSENVLRKLTNLKTLPNVAAIVKKNNELDIRGNVIMLDSIQDPGNLGTIIRSAVAFNIDTIILGDNTVDLYNEKVLRASEGMIFNINIIKKHLTDVIMDLKMNRYDIIGTKVDGGTDIKKIKSKKFALLVGNEGSGVSKELLELCDNYAYIKMNEKCESLNVGVATSIIIHELNKG